MSEKDTDQNLQFDKAEFETASAPATCGMCAQPLHGQYFTVNMQSMCATCTETVRAGLARKSTFGDVMKSILFGIGAGIAGALIYYAVLKFTGYEIGLIAILVGYMVGKAVMIGSDYRGGLKYRAIAVLITYVAIVSTYVPLVFAEGKRQHEAAMAKEKGAVTSSAAAPAVTNPSAAAANSKTEKKPAAAPQEKMTLGEALLGLAIFAGYMFILPFLAGASNIIGILIILFALFEAARRTAKAKLSIEGPFEIHA